MPTVSQGDIFQAAQRVQLAIVFGYLGFNQMRQGWTAFAQGHPQLHNIDPFRMLSGRAVEWSQGRWLWFVPESHVMTDAELQNALEAAFEWASQNQIASVATNGIANTDHGIDTAANRRSDAQRAAWLMRYAEEAESKYNIAVELVSLNDVFVLGEE